MADILIVDDDADTAEILCDVLLERGHEVRVAHDGRDGLAHLHLRLPDLVVLDVEMPVLTGPEMAYEMFLRDHGLEHVPIILSSGVWDLQAVAAVVGTPYFLAKPFMLAAMLSLIERALRERTAPRPNFPKADR